MKRAEWQALLRQLTPRTLPWPTLAVMLADAALVVLAWHAAQRATLGAALLACAFLTLLLLHAYLWLHEASHGALFGGSWADACVGHVCGLLIVMPFAARRRSHLLHHAFTGHPVRDPANRRAIARFSVMSKREEVRLERVWRSWLPLLTLNDRIGLWREPFEAADDDGGRRMGRERAMVGLYAALYVALLAALAWRGWLGAACALYLPAWLFLLLLEELVNLPHHAEAPLLEPEARPLALWEQDRVTHSCRSLPVWSSFVLLHFNLHTAHHFFPTLPWWKLPAAHRALLQHLPDLARDQQTRNELAWSLIRRRQPLMSLMGHYFRRARAAE